MPGLRRLYRPDDPDPTTTQLWQRPPGTGEGPGQPAPIGEGHPPVTLFTVREGSGVGPYCTCDAWPTLCYIGHCFPLPIPPVHSCGKGRPSHVSRPPFTRGARAAATLASRVSHMGRPYSGRVDPPEQCRAQSSYEWNLTGDGVAFYRLRSMLYDIY